ncbi:MAG TPA: sugar ABC transporter permease [Candidatus Deferrimicrobiaceae bacterium]
MNGAADVAGAAAPEARSRLRDRTGALAPLMIAPAILYVAAMIGVPFLIAIAYSLSDVTTGDPTMRFVGLENFREILADPVFLLALRHTFIFALVSQSLVIVLSRIIATALMKPFRGKWLARFLIMLPWTAPISLGTIGWLWMLDSIFSPFDWILRWMGLLGSPGALLGPLTNLYWLGQPGLAMASVILVHVWRLLPLATVIQLAGLSSIPRDLLEAAEVDGATGWRRTVEITIPLTLPIISIAFLFGLVFTFTDVTVVYVLTRGGPIHMTQVLSTWTFFKGIEGGDLAQGAAISLFLFPVLAGIAVLMLRLARKSEVV